VLTDSDLVLIFVAVISFIGVFFLLAFFGDDLAKFLLSLLLLLKIILLGCCFHGDARVDLREKKAEDTFSVFPIQIV
jgi:hypothetical protein